jgi:hypothetical protein
MNLGPLPSIPACLDPLCDPVHEGGMVDRLDAGFDATFEDPRHPWTPNDWNRQLNNVFHRQASGSPPSLQTDMR